MQSIRSLETKEIADKVLKAKFIHKVKSDWSFHAEL